MILQHGSPSDLSGRSEREIRTYEFLDSLGIQFDRTDHPNQPATSMEVCADVDAILNVHICKNLFLCNRQKTNFYLLVMPGDKPFKTKELSNRWGLAGFPLLTRYMEQFLDIHPGSVSILGLMNDKEHRVNLAIDEDVLKEEMFGCHPCENTSSIRFKTKISWRRSFQKKGGVHHPSILWGRRTTRNIWWRWDWHQKICC